MVGAAKAAPKSASWRSVFKRKLNMVIVDLKIFEDELCVVWRARDMRECESERKMAMGTL